MSWEAIRLRPNVADGLREAQVFEMQQSNRNVVTSLKLFYVLLNGLLVS